MQHKIAYNSANSRKELYKSLKINGLVFENMEKGERELILANNIYPNVAATPYFLGKILLLDDISTPIPIGNIKIRISKQVLIINQNEKEEMIIDLGEWIERQEEDRIINPEFDFQLENIRYKLLISDIALEQNNSDDWRIQMLIALLFSSHSPLASQ